MALFKAQGMAESGSYAWRAQQCPVPGHHARGMGQATGRSDRKKEKKGKEVNIAAAFSTTAIFFLSWKPTSKSLEAMAFHVRRLHRGEGTT